MVMEPEAAPAASTTLRLPDRVGAAVMLMAEGSVSTNSKLPPPVLVEVVLMGSLSPSVTLMVAVFLFPEPFTPSDMISFGCVWTAIAIAAVDGGALKLPLRSRN